MNSPSARLGFGLLTGVLFAAPALAKPLSDLVSREKRQSIIEQAQRLTRPATLTPLPPDLAQPFSPPNFEQPDPEEIKAGEAARARAAQNAPVGPAVAGGPASPAAPTGDREILETIANMLPPTTGTITREGTRPRLVFGKRGPVELGSHLTVTNPATNQDYDVELVAIDPPTYTLRYRNEEITRPIKSGKTK